MANQANQGNQGKHSQRGNRDREGNLGHAGGDPNHPAGTSGRQVGSDPNRKSTHRPDGDEESGLGNRNTNR
jgi:hypothetical protein